jgi:hypothetical protein
VWAEVRQYAYSARDVLWVDPLPETPRTSRGAWAARFPAPRVRTLDKALDECNEDDSDDATLKAFIKREKLLKADSEGLFETTPRLIQGVFSQHQNDTGPVTYDASKWLARTWSWPRSPILYASGLTANKLGAAFQWVRDTYPDYIIFESDQTSYDGCVADDARDLEFDVTYGPHRLSTLEVTAREQHALKTETQGIKGATKNGIRYGDKVTHRGSGQGATSGGNSQINGLTQASCANFRGIRVSTLRDAEDDHGFECPAQCGHRTREFLCAVLGDDNFAFVHPEKAGKFEESISDWLVALGFLPKLHRRDHWMELEFCSGRFWPSTSGIVWGPKIGRVLAKTFWSLQQFRSSFEAARWLRGVALGMLRDTAHIPVLRVIIRHTLHLTGGVPARAIVDKHKPHAEFESEAVDESFEMMARLYQLTPYDVADLERRIASVEELPVLVEHPALTAILDVDVPSREEDHARMDQPAWWLDMDRHIRALRVNLADLPRGEMRFGSLICDILRFIGAVADLVLAATEKGAVLTFWATLKAAFRLSPALEWLIPARNPLFTRWVDWIVPRAYPQVVEVPWRNECPTPFRQVQVLLAPFYEEVAKRRLPIVAWALPLAEAVPIAAISPTYAIVHFVVHRVWGAMPLPLGIGCHLAWNAWVLTNMLGAQRYAGRLVGGLRGLVGTRPLAHEAVAHMLRGAGQRCL